MTGRWLWTALWLSGIWFSGRAAGGTKNEKDPQPQQVGRELRLMMLKTPPDGFGFKPSAEFPNVYAVIMDWPIGAPNIATIVSALDGSASLYTTSTFGIIGGESHPGVRRAAIEFVRAAERFVPESKRTDDFAYPAADRVRFFLLTFTGVRVIETDLGAVSSGKATESALFLRGQTVLTELREMASRRSADQK